MADLSKIMDDTARDMGATPLSVRADMVNCAETDGEVFFYNPAFMSELESRAGEDGVRFVVAHEMGHQVGGMGHGGHAGEFMADEFAAQSLARTGGDPQAIHAVFSFLNTGESETHPASSSRADRAAHAFKRERSNVVDMIEPTVPKNGTARELDFEI